MATNRPEPTSAIPLADAGAGVGSSGTVVERHMRSSAMVQSFGGGGTMVTLGVFTLLLGAWAGIVPFVGPLFGYDATGTRSWVWSYPHALLWLVPGAVAVLTGILLASQAPGISAGIARSAPWLIGALTVICGAWLVIGPLAWPVLRGRTPFLHAAPLRELSYWIGYSLGPGVLLCVLGGCAMGVAMLNRRNAGALATPVANAESSRISAA
jgi:hypothetical protein